MDTQKLVSMRIQQLCAEHGYNINSLARQAGIPPTTLKNIIYGKSHNPGIVTIKLICDGLGISIYDFFDNSQFKSKIPEDVDWSGKVAYIFPKSLLEAPHAFQGRGELLS